jgi:predicted nucleotidyltransferase/uncharacterized protein (UPF0332 family)
MVTGKDIKRIFPDISEKEQKLPIPTRRKELRQIRIAREDYNIAYDFAGKVYKKFGPLVLSIVVFGSVAKGIPRPESDIDIIIVVDNVSQVWDEEVISWYREELFNLTKNEQYRDRVHINTVSLSSFWENVLAGEPAIINMLRYGVALVDLGFFEPLKYLLISGKIKHSPEAIYASMNRTPWHVLRARIKTLSAIEDFYWAMVDSSQAALMMHGRTPPSPEHISELLSDVFVRNRKLQKSYVEWFNELYLLAHAIQNNQVQHISGEAYDKWLRRTVEFTKVMENITKSGERSYFKK